MWLGAVVSGLAFWGSWSAWPPGGYLAPLIVAIGMVGLAATWLVRTPRSLALQLSALATSVAATLGHEGIGIHVRQYYSTDSGAFNQVAAQMALHGANPYTHTMAAASQLLQTPSDYWTYTVTGGHINAVSYPAGSFLMEVPALWLGFQHQIVDWMDLLAWLVTGALIFVLVPICPAVDRAPPGDHPHLRRRLRFRGHRRRLPALPGRWPSGGGTGSAAVGAPAWPAGWARWRWAWPAPSSRPRGSACRSWPWPCTSSPGPPVAVRCASRPGYLAVVAGVFTLVNLPYLLSSPSAWARGTVPPFSKPLVADGQGLVTLALHGVARGVSLPLLTLASVLVYVTLVAALVIWYPEMKRLWMLLLPLTFFVAARSLLSYLIDFYPAAVVAARVGGAGGRRPGRPARPTPGPVAA